MASAFFTGITLLFWMTIISGFIILIVVIFSYNSIAKNRNSVIRAWADVVAYERQKNNVLPQLEVVVEKYQQYEHGLQMQIIELRTSINKIKPDELNNKDLKLVEDQTRALIQGIKVAVENYPDLKTSNLMQKLMHEIAKQQENIVAAITIFNKNIEEFNNSIQIFPEHIVNDYINKQKKIEPFLDQKALDAFEYKLKV